MWRHCFRPGLSLTAAWAAGDQSAPSVRTRTVKWPEESSSRTALFSTGQSQAAPPSVERFRRGDVCCEHRVWEALGATNAERTNAEMRGGGEGSPPVTVSGRGGGLGGGGHSRGSCSSAA